MSSHRNSQARRYRSRYRRRNATALQPGDVVHRTKGPVVHVGIAVDEQTVWHNMPGRGEHISSMREFAAGHRVSVARQSPSEQAANLDHVSQRSRHPRPYRLLTNNCEHSVGAAQSLLPESPQLKDWVLGIGAGIATFAVTRHIGWSVGVGGFMLARKARQRRQEYL